MFFLSCSTSHITLPSLFLISHRSVKSLDDALNSLSWFVLIIISLCETESRLQASSNSATEMKTVNLGFPWREIFHGLNRWKLINTKRGKSLLGTPCDSGRIWFFQKTFFLLEGSFAVLKLSFSKKLFLLLFCYYYLHSFWIKYDAF